MLQGDRTHACMHTGKVKHIRTYARPPFETLGSFHYHRFFPWLNAFTPVFESPFAKMNAYSWNRWQPDGRIALTIYSILLHLRVKLMVRQPYRYICSRIVTQKGVLRLAMCKTSATHEGL